MTLEASFQLLSTRFEILRDAVGSLHVTMVEDKPLEGDVALVDGFGNAAEDLLGCVEEAVVAAQKGRQAVAYPVDIPRARWALVICQQQFNSFAQRFSSDLVSYERIAELVDFGSKRGGEWRSWSNSVKEALNQCHQPSYDVNQALFLCWQEIAERAGMNSVSVRTTNIGQQIGLPEGEKTESREMVGEGVP